MERKFYSVGIVNTQNIMSSPGYTDEVAEECHDLIDRAEEEAHVRFISSHPYPFFCTVPGFSSHPFTFVFAMSQ
jgi:hypothetical protein